jgi:1-acyl-sn-glycerol-3-phosphate acyltransferase
MNIFLRIFDFLHQRRRLCFGLLTLLVGVLVVMMSTLKYNENIYDFLPVSGNEQKAITLYQDITGGQRIVAMFKAKRSTPALADSSLFTLHSSLTSAVDTFANRLLTGDGRKHIKEVTTQVDFEKFAGVTDFIYHNMPVMLTDSDYQRMEQIVTSEELMDNQLANDVQMMMMPATGVFTSSIANDPLGLFSPVIDRLQARQSSLPMEMDDGYIFTAGKEYAIAMLTSPYGSMESANNGLLVAYVDSAAQYTMQAVPGVEVATTGSPVIAVGNARQIWQDSRLAISIAVTLILLLLVYSFRRVKNLLLIGVAIAFGWLFAMSFIAVVRSDVSLIVLGIGSIIIGIAVNYPLHFIAHTDHGGTVRDVLKEMVAPLLIGNITTVGAFASLIPLDAPALRDLGLFAAFMLVGTILFVLIFLPHLVSKRTEQKEERLSFGRISSMSPERHRWVLLVILLLTVLFGYYSLDTSFDTNMHHINYMTDQQQELLANLNASAGINDTTNVYLVTEGNTWDEALEARERLTPLLDSVIRNGRVETCSNVTAFICSTQEQQRRIERWNTFWQKHRDHVMAALTTQAPRYEFSEEAFSDFNDIINATYTPQTFDYFEPIRSVLLSNAFSTSTGKCSVVDVINTQPSALNHESSPLTDIESTLSEAVGDKGYVFDFMGMNSAIAKSLSDDFNYIGFACGFIVFVFLWLSFGRLELALLAFLPMALGWIWILGIMSLLNMQFNIVNVILATFIFGQGDDYTIFITDGLINEYAYRKRLLPSFKNSIIISALIMFIGIGSLIVAKHPALHSLAEVTIVGMLTVVLMAWVVPPLVFDWMTRTNGQRRHVPVTIEQLIRTGYCTVAYLFELGYGCLFGFVARLLPWNEKSREAWFHRVVHKTMLTDINHIWGVKPVIRNDYGEDFSRGSIIVCNHMSMLDPIYVLAVSPHILCVMGEKVWRNPIVHNLFKLAGFMSIQQPLDVLTERIRKAVADGYNVMIFPEGLRADNRIMRFHKGAFHIAQEIGADILPMYIHGSGHVMPKGSGPSARGQITIEVGKRIPVNELQALGTTNRAITKHFHQLYLEHYEQMRREIEDTHYFHHYVIYKYLYKGFGIERETRRLLKRYDDFSQWIDGYQPDTHLTSPNVVSVLHAGRGQFALLFALVHPNLNVHAYIDDPDDAALAAACEPLPENLHIHYCNDEKEALASASGTNIINLSDIINL